MHRVTIHVALLLVAAIAAAGEQARLAAGQILATLTGFEPVFPP